MGFVQAVVGKKKFLVQFKDGQRREMSSCLLLYVCSEEDIGQEVNETISDLPPKGEGELLTIVRDPVDEGDHMFEEGMYLSVFYCFCFANEISADMLEGQSREERDSDLEVEEDIMILDNREKHRKDVIE